MLSERIKMKRLVIFLVTLTLCCVTATPAPQNFPAYQPFPQIGSFFQNFPRPFQNGFFNPFNGFRPQAQVVQPPSQPIESVPVQPPPIQYPQQLTQSQSPQVIEVPNRQVNNWFWQNWVPLPWIPQYSDGPTIIIVSRPPKKPASENSNNAVTSESNSSPNSNAHQSTSMSVPNVDNLQNSTAMATETTVSALTSASSTEASTQGTNTASNPAENVTSVQEIGLTVMNVPLAPMNTSVTEVKAQ